MSNPPNDHSSSDAQTAQAVATSSRRPWKANPSLSGTHADSSRPLFHARDNVHGFGRFTGAVCHVEKNKGIKVFMPVVYDEVGTEIFRGESVPASDDDQYDWASRAAMKFANEAYSRSQNMRARFEECGKDPATPRWIPDPARIGIECRDNERLIHYIEHIGSDHGFKAEVHHISDALGRAFSAVVRHKDGQVIQYNGRYAATAGESYGNVRAVALSDMHVIAYGAAADDAARAIAENH